MTTTGPTLKNFVVEFDCFFAVREFRKAESAAHILAQIREDEPWRLPVTITEVGQGTDSVDGGQDSET